MDRAKPRSDPFVGRACCGYSYIENIFEEGAGVEERLPYQVFDANHPLTLPAMQLITQTRSAGNIIVIRY